MVGELYDYIVSIIVVGIIFVSGVLAVPAIGYFNLRHVDEQQLRNTALNVFDTMLLDAGSPPKWGSVYPFDQNAVRFFGLSMAGQNSLFVLDSDKLQRLDDETPGYITYERVKELLGLNGYDFNLNIFRPFQVNWSIAILNNTTPEQVWFSVNVSRNEDGRPIANAHISVTVMATATKSKTDEPIAIVNLPHVYYTDALGRCEGYEIINLEAGYTLRRAVAVMKITVAGISTMVVAQTDKTLQDVLKVNTYGDTVTLTYRGEMLEDPSGVRRVKKIQAYDFDQLITIYSADPSGQDHITQGEGYEWWNMTFPGLESMDPAMLLFTVQVPIKGEGRTLVIIAGPFSFWDANRVFSFGPASEQVSTTALKLRRYIVFSGMTYDVELTLWKEG